MVLPTLEKTWEFDPNNLFGGTGNQDSDNADSWVKIKDALIGFASGHWTVSASSDGTGGNADTNDNWTDYNDIDWNTPGNAHSWCVLTNSATGFQICMDCNSSPTTSENADVYASPGGNYALGGPLSTNNRPTAIDEFSIKGTAWGGAGSPTNGYMHAWCSSDGECTRVVSCVSGANYLFWIFDKLKNPVEPLTGSWDTPFVFGALGDNLAGYPNFGDLNDVASIKGLGPSAAFSAYLTCEGFAGSMGAEWLVTADSLSNAWPMFPMGVISQTALNIGRKGSMYDIWYGSNGRLTGDTYPNDGSYQFVQFGCLILPWNGSTPLVSV